MKRLSDSRGSLIVESALVLPVVIFSIIAVIYIVFSLYNQTCLFSLLNMSSEQGSYYLAGNLSIEGMSSLSREENLYSNEEKRDDIERYVNEYMNHLSLSYDTSISIPTKKNSSALVKIVAMKGYRLPLMTDVYKRLDRQFISEYYVHDEAEYIRKMDIITDAAYSSITDVFNEAKIKHEEMKLK